MYCICYSWISNLWLICKPFNQIISWLAGFKTCPVYTKSKSRSISQHSRSKSGPTHALDSLAPRVCGQQSFTCAKKKPLESSCETQSDNEASQFFFMLVLALLVSLTIKWNPTSADRFQYPIRTGVGWVSLARLHCLYVSEKCSASFLVVQATGCLFIKLVQLSRHSGCL